MKDHRGVFAAWKARVLATCKGREDVHFVTRAGTITVYRLRPPSPVLFGERKLAKDAGPPRGDTRSADRLVFDGRGQWTLYKGPLDEQGERAGVCKHSLVEAEGLLADLLA